MFNTDDLVVCVMSFDEMKEKYPIGSIVKVGNEKHKIIKHFRPSATNPITNCPMYQYRVK